MFARSRPPLPPTAYTAMQRESAARMLIVKTGLMIFFIVIAVRLADIQIVKARGYQNISKKQNEVIRILPTRRGSIFDRNNQPLVTNSQFVSFGADPIMVAEKSAVSEQFARVFGKSKSYYMEKLDTEGRHFVWLERRVHPSYAKRIGAAQFKGVVVMDEPRRLYHYDHVAGQLLGFTDVDNKGLSGLESQLDSLLRGRDGNDVMQMDGLGRRRPSVDHARIDPVEGNSAVLTIDIEYQAIVEEELRKGVERNSAESGLAVMVDPSTGEVLAMANYPSINPSDPGSVNPALARNRVITDMFEPGSTFKIVTAAAALDRNLVKPGQKFNAEQGVYKIFLQNGKLRNIITDTHKHGIITFQEAMEVSSNIVMAKVSDIVGSELLYTTARNFGFGTETGIELSGEARGELKKPAQWSGTTLNAMAYGYEVGVTPLQLVSAYAAVANGGTLMKPFVVRQIVDPRGKVIAETRPEQVRRVVARSTAQTLTRFLRGVVDAGTGTLASMNGVAVAGKTGTARKYIDGHYIEGSYIASFAGFFPAEDPSVVCLIMLDIPGSPSFTGGLVSAPIFKAIAEKIYATSTRFTRKQSVMSTRNVRVTVPDVTTLKVGAARRILAMKGFEVETQGSGPTVQRQRPAAWSNLHRGTTVVLSTAEAGVPSKGFAIVPELLGLPIRRAINRMVSQQLDASITGSGTVVSQSPRAGEQVRVGTRIAIRCEPKDLPLVTLY